MDIRALHFLIQIMNHVNRNCQINIIRKILSKVNKKVITMFDDSADWNIRMILDNVELLPDIYAKLTLIQADTAMANCLKIYEPGLMDADELEQRRQIYVRQYNAVDEFTKNK